MEKHNCTNCEKQLPSEYKERYFYQCYYCSKDFCKDCWMKILKPSHYIDDCDEGGPIYNYLCIPCKKEEEEFVEKKREIYALNFVNQLKALDLIENID